MVQTGPLAAGDPGHGPFDAVIVEGAVETLPEAIVAQVKPGGRIAAIFAVGAGGQARLGLRTEAGLDLAASLRCHGAGASGLRRDESV